MIIVHPEGWIGELNFEYKTSIERYANTIGYECYMEL